ncbi:MFS transporter [Streptomyces hiroshimensis]|uniref:MFS transporter n=1 Tax=Streptomyces hiroshimensis TaxID=66424 RepID=A0ABQ2YA66_9ACTN|nr:MFS transporter [Streptomyces hiroshimensis]GGX77207.1 MFS transporter [Streptomyces hiroshimensis]
MGGIGDGTGDGTGGTGDDTGDGTRTRGKGGGAPGKDGDIPGKGGGGSGDGSRSEDGSGARRGPVVAALMLTMALAALDGTVVSTAVPQIVADLGGFTVFSWLFSGYLLAVTVTLPVYGKLSDTFGRKPVLLAGIVLFLLGSALCAAAWSMPALIAFRVLQGLGGGALQGTVQTVAADLYPLKERPRIQARLSTVWATAAVAGPALGGVLAGYADWRWIFLINLPVGAVAFWLIKRHLHESAARTRIGAAGTGTGSTDAHARPRARVDWPGALGVFACGGLLLCALVQGGVAWSWLSAPSLALFAGSAVCAAVTAAVERRAAEPVIPGWVWRRRSICAVNLSFGALGLLIIAPTVFLPTYAQAVLGLGPIAAGLVLSVMTLSWPISAALSSRVYNRIGFRNCAALGMSLGALILLSFPLLPHPGAAWQPALVMLALGAALGLFQLPLIVGVQSSVGWAERGTATASILFCRQVGQSVGAALFGAVANGTLAARLADAPASVRPGLPTDLDSVSRALEHASTSLTAEAAGYLRQAVSAAVDHVYLGAAGAAGLALLALLTLAPRQFPVHAGDSPAESAADKYQETGKEAGVEGERRANNT